MTEKMFWKGIPKRTDNIVIMSTDGEKWANLPLYLDEKNHSPTGFAWGYGGSGPHQLGYAILRTYFEIFDGRSPEDAKRFATKFYGKFTWDFVNNFGREDAWELSHDKIAAWLEKERLANIGMSREEEGWV